MKLPVQILSHIPNSANHIIFEITNLPDFSFVENFGISTLQFEKISENFTAGEKKQKKILSFSHVHKDFVKVSYFFPSSDITEDRSNLFTSLQEDVVFIPSCLEVDAFEIFNLAVYTFTQYLTKKDDLPKYNLVVDTKKQEEIQKIIPRIEAIYWARDIINTPPRDANPENIVKAIVSYPWKHFEVQIFDKQMLEKLGCNLLLAVGAGSDAPPYMVVLHPKNPPKTEKYALIGKGVTFDAGGIQIKPDTAMLDMKCDMSGAAGVIATAMYIDTLETLPVNLVVAIGLTENMTGGNAFKPLDIYKAYNGTTVEIHHTDAEGRLVLADVMSYIEDIYKVDHIITMATLTGACIYALGYDIAGIMGDDEMVIRQLIDTTSPYEKVWRLPLNQKFKKSLKAEIADLKNIARSEKAGSSVGGAFLSYFQGNAKLTHLDIAGPAYRETQLGYMPKGGTGWGVKILSEFLISQQVSR